MFLLIDKPKGITSHDVVDRVRRITGEKRVGHAGTLDPNATGLLIIGIGRNSTKRLSKFLKSKKTYEAEVFLGEERDTDDAEGRDQKSKIKNKNYNSKFKVKNEEVKKVLKGFVGKKEQVPPIYSAIKKEGKKAYELARRGKDVQMEPRKVMVYSIKVLEYDFPILKILTEVSAGTYIRALARDIGRKLGCGAYLKNLRRTKVGEYSLEKAVSLDKLTKDNWRDYIFHLN